MSLRENMSLFDFSILPVLEWQYARHQEGSDFYGIIWHGHQEHGQQEASKEHGFSKQSNKGARSREPAHPKLRRLVLHRRLGKQDGASDVRHVGRGI